MKKTDKAHEDWMQKKWRPAMGWSYMLTCIADFVAFPILWSALQAIQGGEVTSQWNPITLQGAGLYHVAMGAVLGVAAWSRGQEKMVGAAENASVPGPAPVVTQPFVQQTSFQASAPVMTGFGGKKAPPPVTNFPEI